MIVLDWTRPGIMVKELITWLKWVEEWAGGTEGEDEERRERCELCYRSAGNIMLMSSAIVSTKLL